MRHGMGTPALMAFAALAACMSQTQLLETYEGTALATAKRHAAAELGCSEIEGTILSRNVTEPIVFGGVKQAEYTIDLHGCGRQTVYRTRCDNQQSCNVVTGAADGR